MGVFGGKCVGLKFMLARTDRHQRRQERRDLEGGGECTGEGEGDEGGHAGDEELDLGPRGHELDEATSPYEVGLGWAGRRNRPDLVALLTVLKGLPLAYNKDLQEDKHVVFDAEDTLAGCTAVVKSRCPSGT
mgnify:CR=1 FL=1